MVSGEYGQDVCTVEDLELELLDKSAASYCCCSPQLLQFKSFCSRHTCMELVVSLALMEWMMLAMLC